MAISGHLTRRLAKLAALWVAGLSVSECSRRLGISRSSVARALRRPEVLAELVAIRDRHLSRVLPMLAEKTPKAIEKLEEMLEEEDPHPVRLAAARAFVDPIVRLASIAAVETAKPGDASAEQKASEIRRFLAAATSIEAGDEVAPPTAAGGGDGR